MTIAADDKSMDDIIDANKLLRIGFLALPPRAERVVRLYYGIGCDGHTLKEIGGLLGKSVERVRQIKAKAERQLKFVVANAKANNTPVVRKRIALEWAKKRNFGAHTPPAQPREIPPYYSGVYYKLVPFIMAMHAEGASSQEIHARIVQDLEAATWLGPHRSVGGYVPTKYMISYIVKVQKKRMDALN